MKTTSTLMSSLYSGLTSLTLALIAIFMASPQQLAAQCAPGTTPTVSAFAIQPSCGNDNTTINSDGYIQLSTVTGGLSYEVNEGSAIDGSGTRTTLTGAAYPLQILTGQTNPTGSRNYTVRIYAEDVGGDATCFIDVVVTMNEQDCSVGCDCQEYIYLNEPALGAVLKFEVGPDTLLTEVIGANGGTPPTEHWYPGTGTSQLPGPHGLATDLNGNVYVGASYTFGTVRKFNCDGEISPIDGTTITSQSQLANMFSIGNTLYTSDANGPGVHDLCTGDFLGTVCLNNSTGIPLDGPLDQTSNGNWGLSYNSTLEVAYATGIFPIKQGVWAITKTELEEGIQAGSDCVDPLIWRNPSVNLSNIEIGDNFLPNNIRRLHGVVSDNAGNIYLSGWLAATGNPGFVLKYDANGGFLASAPADPSYAISRGIVWSEETNRIYVANQTDDTAVDCITVFDADLVNVWTAVPNPDLPDDNNAAKTLAILKECCPTNTNQTVNIEECTGTTSTPTFLNELFPCEGFICNGQWTPADAASEAIYDACSQSLISGVTAGCYSFTRGSDGAGANAACGAFVQTLTISVSEIASGVINTEDQVLCRGEEPTALTATAATGTGGDISYQWYTSIESDSTGYSPITDATALTYAPTAASLVNDTTYFRIVSNITTCTSGMCSDTSEAVVVVVLLDPLMVTAAASCDDENGMQVAENTYYVEVSAITGGDDTEPYDVTMTVDGVAQTQSFTGSSLFFGPFDHSVLDGGVGGAVQTVSVQDNRLTSDCPTLAEVPEVLCGINDGRQASGCFCDGPTTDPATPTSFILAQSEPGTFMAGGTSGQVQKYLLVNDAGFITHMNLTGLFEVPVAGTYTPYAINYRLDEEATLLPYFDVGDPIQPILDGLNGLGDLAGLCYTTCNIDTPVTYETCSCYSVGSTIFADLNNDGMLNTGEGENGLTGITVEIYAAGANPLVDDPLATTTTNSSGDYYFGGLDPADYFINLPATPAGYPNSSTITDTADNGEDNDDNGIQAMAGDPTTSPVFTLGNVEGEPIGAAESGSGGTQDDAADAFGDMTQDFGFFAPVTIGDTTFVDVDMDGTQSAGDLALENVTVTIIDVATGLPVALDAEGMAYTATQTTSDMGAYLFENLPPGNYYVEFNIGTVTTAAAAYYDFTTPNAGSDDLLDSDAVPALATDNVANSPATGLLLSGQSDLSLDAGVVCVVEVTVADPSTICSTVRIDLTTNASVTPPSILAANWTSDGTGDFIDNGEVVIAVAPYAFGTARYYVPSDEDKARGYVILTLTTEAPPVGSGCGPAMESVRVDILKVDCGLVPWNGQ